MRSRFTAARTETVVIKRGDEEVSLTLTAPPASFDAYLAACMPEPVIYRDGKVSEEQNPKAAEWGDLRFYVMIGKALEPSGELESTRKGDQPREWEAYARAVRAEFQAAGFTDSDMIKLGKAMTRLRFGADLPAEKADGG